ncbi:MAG: hypothetical protein PHI55_13250, partial [Burkholderiaceae bacterium]|nr:hypothetical protein [Burkholderiaceae bacterium]
MTSLPVDGGPGLGGALRQAYQAVRRHLPDGAPAQVLHIGAEHSGVVSGTGADPAEGVVWPLGAHQIVRACFRRTVPTPLELENAIAVIEDALMHPRPLALGGATVWCADPQVRDIARRAGLPLEAGG